MYYILAKAIFENPLRRLFAFYENPVRRGRIFFSPKAGDENPLNNAGWSLLWETRFGAGRVFPKGKRPFLENPLKGELDLVKISSALRLPFCPSFREG